MRITERLATIAPNPTNPYFFVVIHLGWAWFFWGFIVLSRQSVWTFPNVCYSILVDSVQQLVVSS